MDVRHAAEVPDKGRAFEPENVVFARPQMALLEEGEMAFIEPALRLEASDRAVAV
jgi:hypothetical protein